MQVYRALTTTIVIIFLGILLLSGALFLARVTPLFGDVSLRVVHSGSMDPTIPVGSLVVSAKSTSYTVGDIVTYGSTKKESMPTMHRIVTVTQNNGYTQFTTKGDANTNVDPTPVPNELIQDKVALHIPLIGYAIEYLQTKQGFLIVVVLPALYIIFEEMFAVYRWCVTRIQVAKKVPRIKSSIREVSSTENSEAYTNNLTTQVVLSPKNQLKPWDRVSKHDGSTINYSMDGVRPVRL